ncbi:glycosyltransferase family 2 protein [Bacteroidota bacterium]
MSDIKFKVSIIIPVFNEEGCISLLVKKVIEIVQIYYDYEVLLIDDGSTDKTLQILKKLNSENQKIKYISFSRNFGHQSALRAGIKKATGECIISLDADFQHPPELIPEMIEKWKEGYDIVYTLRRDNIKIPFFKKFTARLFYKILNIFSDIKIEQGAADFRLINKKVAASLNEIRENDIFFRGMVKWLGFKQIGIEYEPNERYWGNSKYSIKKMVSFAFSGITSFSVRPLKISFFIGTVIAFLSILYGFYALYIKVFTDNSVTGWTSVFFMVTFIGGVQLIMLGVLGEYIGKLFIESKNRPHYVIKESSTESDFKITEK